MGNRGAFKQRQTVSGAGKQADAYDKTHYTEMSQHTEMQENENTPSAYYLLTYYFSKIVVCSMYTVNSVQMQNMSTAQNTVSHNALHLPFPK